LQPESSIPELDKSGSPDAAVAIIINPKVQGGSILLIRRTERKDDPWSGQVAFPGGHRSLNDRTFSETVVRETSEEVGIILCEHEMLGVLPLVYSRTRWVLVAPFVFQLRSDVIIRLNEEVAESFWVPLDELLKIEATKSEVHVRDGKLMVDSYVYDGHVIWGLTFRIINILLNRS
jgi:8-oxo-dGTP pyrophosphatase MutT (NUDIX family)